MAKSDWNFNKDSWTVMSVAQQQYYPAPFNMRSASYLNVFANNQYYVPSEIRSGKDWRQINYITTVYSDVVSRWFVSNRTKQFGLYPIPANSDNPITLGFTKATKVYGAADYDTGTVSTTANSVTVVGDNTTAWDKSMIGNYIQIMDDTSILNGIWIEISDVPDANTLTLRYTVPISVAEASYIIAEMIPFLDGFEDIALYMALETYYRMRELENQADFWKLKWGGDDGSRGLLAEMKQRDQRSENDLMKKQNKNYRYDPNRDPFAIRVS